MTNSFSNEGEGFLFHFMFDLIKDFQNLERENVTGNFFYSLDYIRKYVQNKCALKVNQIDCVKENKEGIAVSISNQFTVYLKNRILSYVLVHEYNVAKKAAVLEGANSEEQFSDFISLTNQKDWIIYITEKYPKLKEKINGFVNNFLSYINDFFDKLQKDWPLISLEFGALHRIKNLSLFLGDLHKDNSFVLSVIFNEGKKVFFKPRNFENEKFFSDFVSFLNEINFNISTSVPKSVSFENYCWVEELKPINNFLGFEEVEKYYENLGKVTCIFHLLGSIDIIPDNLIVSNNTPGFFDLECIIEKPKLLNRYSLRYELGESVFKTGVLPDKIFNNNFKLEILSSVFFKFNEQKVTENQWVRDGSFNFSLTEVSFKDANAKDLHLPNLKGELVEINSKLLDTFIRGFEHCYNSIIEKKLKIFKYLSSYNFDYLNLRVLLHTTSVYEFFLNESNLPENLSSTNRVSKRIKELVENSLTDNYKINKNKLTKSVKSQVFNNDIPFFYHSVKTGMLYDGFDRVVCDNWNFSPKIFLQERLISFSPSGLELQKNMIKKKTEFVLNNKVTRDENNFINSKKTWKTTLEAKFPQD